MAKQLKPRRWWAVGHADGAYIDPSSIRQTRKLAIEAFCSTPTLWPKPWTFWQSRGFRAVRVTVTVESKGDGK